MRLSKLTNAVCSFLFLCSVVNVIPRIGTEPLKVVWVHNDAVIKDCAEFAYVDYGRGRFGLRLNDAFTQDEGIYICEVYNSYGESESWCYLAVTDMNKSGDRNGNSVSVIKSTLSGAEIEEGRPQSHPIANAYSSENAASADVLDANYQSCEMRAENIKEIETDECARKEDIYSSKEDFNCEELEDVKVNCEENIFEISAQIIKGPASVSTLVGSTVVLEALVIGRPEPCIRWLKGVIISFFYISTYRCVLTKPCQR